MEAFKGCTGLGSIEIPDGVQTIDMETFSGCTGLTSLELSNSVQTISTGAFEGCIGLTSIEIPNSVQSIERHAFSGCTGLECMFIPESLNIADARIPDTVTKVFYRLDSTKGEVTITNIEIANGISGVAIPSSICNYSVVAVADGLLEKITSHTCIGGKATCTNKAVCIICGEQYGQTKNHNLDKIPAKPSTVIEVGNKEYWHCTACGKYFADADASKEIIDLETWKTGEGLISKLQPEIIEGSKQSITAGDKVELVFRSNAVFSDFIKVVLDGETLDENSYTVKEGSTIVTLKADFVGELSAGYHTIGIVSTGGTAYTTFSINAKTPDTGDNSKMTLWIVLLLISLTGLSKIITKNNCLSHS